MHKVTIHLTPGPPGTASYVTWTSHESPEEATKIFVAGLENNNPVFVAKKPDDSSFIFNKQHIRLVVIDKIEDENAN